MKDPVQDDVAVAFALTFGIGVVDALHDCLDSIEEGWTCRLSLVDGTNVDIMYETYDVRTGAISGWLWNDEEGEGEADKPYAVDLADVAQLHVY